MLLSTASEEIGWWLRNDLARFDPHTVEAVEDEVAGWRVARSRARAIVAEYNVAGRSPAQVRSAVLTDYIYTLPAARAALAHARAGGSSRLLMIGPTELTPAVHGTELYALVGQEDTDLVGIVVPYGRAGGGPH